MVRLLFNSFFLIQLIFRDAWAKHKDLDPFEAKWLYVDALLKVCLARCCHLYRDMLIEVRCSESILERL